MTIRNDTDDNLVAEWQQVEIPNELRAPAHKHTALLVRDGKQDGLRKRLRWGPLCVSTLIQA